MSLEWESRQLGEVCSLLNRGISPKYLEKGGIQVLNQKCVRNHAVDYAFARRHDSNIKKVDPNRILRTGDVLVNSTGTGTLGRVAQLRTGPDEPTTVDSHITIVRPESGLFYPEFFGYVMIDIEDALKKAGEGASGQTELARSILAKNFTVHYPKSIAEQHRIVAILDQAFAVIAIAKANAEKNLQNAQTLLARALKEEFGTYYAIGRNVRLLELATDITDGDHMPPPKSVDGVPFITIRNINKLTRKIDFSNTFTVSREYFDHLKANRKPRKGDVLYTVTGSYGIPILLEDDAEFCFQRHIGLIRPKPDTDSEWLYYLLLSPQVFEQADGGATGTAQKTVSLKVLRNIVAPSVSMEEQMLSAKKLRRLDSEVSQLEQSMRRKIAALDELKQALLTKAFSGEL